MFSIEDFDSKTQAELKKIKSPEDVIRMFEVLDIRDFDEMFDWKYKILPKYVADCTLNCYMRYIFIPNHATKPGAFRPRMDCVCDLT